MARNQHEADISADITQLSSDAVSPGTIGPVEARQIDDGDVGVGKVVGIVDIFE